MAKKIVLLGLTCFIGLTGDYLLRSYILSSPKHYSLNLTESEIQAGDREKDWYRIDNSYGLFHQPNAKRKVEWEEHKDKYFEMKSNNLGFRNDKVTEIKKPKGMKRLLILGDSHTDGVLPNSESVASDLEALSPGWEVLNGGVGHYSAQNYLWAFKKNLKLNFDAIVVVIYSGNDFAESIVRLLSTQVPIRNEEYNKSIKKLFNASPAALSQGLNQTFLFRTYPYLKSTSIDSVLVPLLEIQKIAREERIQSFYILLPTKLDLEWEMDAEKTNKAALELNMTKEEILNEQLELKHQFIDSAAIHGLPIVDATDYFRIFPEEKYWKKDHHLNVAGHKRLAEIIQKNFKIF